MLYVRITPLYIRTDTDTHYVPICNVDITISKKVQPVPLVPSLFKYRLSYTFTYFHVLTVYTFY